jgi:MFS family permease
MYSISTNFFPDNKDAMVGYIEAVTGVGLILGPLMGSGLYALGGQRFIFFSFGTLFILASFSIKSVFGPDIDQMNTLSDVSLNIRDGQTLDDKIIQLEAKNLKDSSGDEEQTPKTHESLKLSLPIQKKVVIGTFELLRYPRFLLSAFSGTLGYFLFSFMEPILALRAEEFKLTQVQIGLFFIINPIFYIPTSIFVQKVPKGV